MFPIAPDNRERFAPVSLPREKPVAQFVIDRAFALAALLQPRSDFLFRVRGRQSVDDRRINRNALADESGRRPIARWLDNFNNRQIEFIREFKIALVMRRYSANRARAITGQNVIDDPDGNL